MILAGAGSSGVFKKEKAGLTDQDLTFTKISSHSSRDQENSNVVNLNNIQPYMLIKDGEGNEYLFEIGTKIFVGSSAEKCHVVIKDIPEIFFAIGFRKGQVLFKHFGENHFLYKDYNLIPCKTYHLPNAAELSCSYFKVTVLNYKPFSMPIIPVLDPTLFAPKIEELLEKKVLVEDQKIPTENLNKSVSMLNKFRFILAYFLRFAIVFKTGPYFGTVAENYPIVSEFYLKMHLWFENLIVKHHKILTFLLDNSQDINASAAQLASLISGAILFDLSCHILLGVSLGEAFLGLDQNEMHFAKRLKGFGRCILSYIFFPIVILSISGKGIVEKICKFSLVPTTRSLPVELLTTFLGITICVYSLAPKVMTDADLVKENQVVHNVSEVPESQIAPISAVLPDNEHSVIPEKAKESVKKKVFLGRIKGVEIGHILEMKGPIIRKSLLANEKDEKHELKIQLQSKIFHHDFLSLGSGAILKIQLNNGKILAVMQKTDATVYSSYQDVEKDIEVVLDFGKVVYDTNQDIHNKIIKENKYTPTLILKSEDSAAAPIGGRGQFSYRKSLLLTTLFVIEGQCLFFPLAAARESQSLPEGRAMTIGADHFSVYYHNAWKASVPVLVKKKEVKQVNGVYNLFHSFVGGGDFNPISGLYFLKEDNYFDVLLRLRTEKGTFVENILGNGEKIIFERIDVIGRLEDRQRLF